MIKQQTMSEPLQYTTAFRELNAIAAEIEEGEIPVDELIEKVKRSVALIRICKEILVATEANVTDALKDLL